VYGLRLGTDVLTTGIVCTLLWQQRRDLFAEYVLLPTVQWHALLIDFRTRTLVRRLVTYSMTLGIVTGPCHPLTDARIPHFSLQRTIVALSCAIVCAEYIKQRSGAWVLCCSASYHICYGEHSRSLGSVVPHVLKLPLFHGACDI
jgi:hypothetical protein